MLNCFENNVIGEILKENLKILLDKFEKYFSQQKEKIENENIIKQ